MATQDKLNRLLQTKEDIKAAIIAKGVTVADDDTFASYANKIAEITTGGGSTTSLKDVILGLCLNTDDGKISLLSFFSRKYVTKELFDVICELAKEYPIGNIANFCQDNIGADEGLVLADDVVFTLSPSSSLASTRQSNAFEDFPATGHLQIVINTGDNSSYTVDTSYFAQNAKNITKLTLTKNATNTCSAYALVNGCSSLVEAIIDSATLTNFQSSFSNCSALKTIVLNGGTALVTTFNTAFSGCESLESITGLDFSVCTSLRWAFTGCSSLTSLDFSTLTSKCTTLDNCFNNCTSLKEILNLNITKITTSTLQSCKLETCTSLEKLTFQGTETRTLTNTVVALPACPLTSGEAEYHDNLVEMINSLPTCESAATLILTSVAIASLTEEEIAVATAKNWTLADETAAVMMLPLTDEDYEQLETLEEGGEDELV